MNHSGDVAEQVVRMTLEGTEVAAKITGSGAKQVAILIYAILRDQKKTKGKTMLTNMLKSGKELKVFAVKDADLPKFCSEAKKYGVLYSVLKDKDAKDGITDIMVRAEDASKINRIFERFQLASVDMCSVKEEIEQQEKGFTLDELSKTSVENPIEVREEKFRPSAPISKTKGNAAKDSSNEKPSVKKELREIRSRQRTGSDNRTRRTMPTKRGKERS